MYRVLLVDDERIIREGIAATIPWEQCGVKLVGTAQNGLEAYERIRAEHPEIVITDLKMPGLSGLELIAKGHQLDPEIQFVVLSGYGEFDYAREAMAFGVRYYLLKPCNEEQIMDVLAKIRQELDRRTAEVQNARENQAHLQKVLPLVREEFLRNFMIRGQLNSSDFSYYCQLLQLEDRPYQIILLVPTDSAESGSLSGLSRLCRKVFDDHLLLECLLKGEALFWVEPMEQTAWTVALDKLKTVCQFYYSGVVHIVYSQAHRFFHSPLIYRQLRHFLNDYLITVGKIPQQLPDNSGCRVVTLEEVRPQSTHNKLILTLLAYVQTHLDNEALSLKWLAQEVVHMNEAYLSKLFIKETGQRFSHYLMALRMIKAQELIAGSEEDRIYEVARQVGFGNNPQYFSQIFKKYTGLTPSEYKRERSQTPVLPSLTKALSY